MLASPISITFLLEKIDDKEFYTLNNDFIIKFVNKHENLNVIKDILIRGKKYSVLKLIEKTNLQIDSELYIKYLNNDLNYNYNFYELIFTLFIKDLIDTKCLETIRNKLSLHFCNCNYNQTVKLDYMLNGTNYKQNRIENNKTKQFYAAIIHLEEKILLKKLECDRYFMKKN